MNIIKLLEAQAKSVILSKKLLHSPRSKTHIAEIDQDTSRAIDTFIDLLDGKHTAMHVKSLLPLDYCQQLEARFRASPLRKKRPDNVPGYEAGVTQYMKSPLLLSKLAYSQQGGLRQILGTDPDNPIMAFFRELAVRAYKNAGYIIRPAAYGAEPMPILRFSQWMKQRPDAHLLVEMHDDLAQVKAPLNTDFEIHGVERLLAYNFYPRCVKGSGQLCVLDWQPSDEEREMCGVKDTGYPYRSEDIPEGVSRHVFEQQTGDLVVMDGSYVHGVLVGKDECDDRLVVNGFAAVLKNKQVVLFA